MPPQALFDAMDTYIGERAAEGHLPRRRRALRHRGRRELRRPPGRDHPRRRALRRGARRSSAAGRCCSTTASRRPSPTSRSSPSCTRSTGPRSPWSPRCARSPRARRRPAPDAGSDRALAHYAGRVPAGTSTTILGPEAVIAAWRAESARLVGALTRMTRDVDARRGPRAGRARRRARAVAGDRRPRQPGAPG